MKKIYIIRKIVVADSIEEAIRNEKKFKVEDAWIDDFSFKDAKEELIKKHK